MTTLITFLLDRTGSMGPIAESTMTAFNAYVDALRETPATEFSLIQFDSISIEKTCVNVPIQHTPRLSVENYQPRASTPLIDAVYKTIKAVEASVLNRPWINKVIICILTDGYENCSHQHTWQQLNTLIKAKTEIGWAFNFMGASIDAYAQGLMMGIGVSNTVTYDSKNWAATQSIFTSRAATHSNYSMGLVGSAAISTEEKLAAGDAYAPELKKKATGVGLHPAPTPKLVEDFTL